MVKNMAVVAAVSLLISACAGSFPPRQDLTVYPHIYKSYDLGFAWKTVRTGSDLTIEGTVTNNRNQFLRSLELTLELLDEKGHKLSTATFFFIPDDIRLDEVKPFDLKLRIPPDSTPNRLKFHYSYHLADERGGYHLPYTYDFEAGI